VRFVQGVVRTGELYGTASVLSVHECESILQCIPLRDSLSAHMLSLSRDPEIVADGGFRFNRIRPRARRSRTHA
jgi:hypothetical protein